MSVRKSITISDEMALYFEEKSKVTGVSQASLIVLAISEYLEQMKKLEKDKK